MFDVIVVGAGPAGCKASKVLAEKGYKVLLVEKFKMFCQKYFDNIQKNIIKKIRIEIDKSVFPANYFEDFFVYISINF